MYNRATSLASRVAELAEELELLLNRAFGHKLPPNRFWGWDSGFQELVTTERQTATNTSAFSCP